MTHETLLLIVAGVQDHLYQLKVHRGQQEEINKNDNDNKDTNNSCYSPSCHSSSSTSINSFSCDDLYEVSTALEEIKFDTSMFDSTPKNITTLHPQVSLAQDTILGPTDDTNDLCSSCNKKRERFSVELLNRAKTVHKQDIVCKINSETINMCINCSTSYTQVIKQNDKNDNLNKIMHKIVHYTEKPQWDMNSKKQFNMSSLLKLFIPMHDELLEDKHYRGLCSESLEYVVYENDVNMSKKQYRERGIEIEGGYMDKSFTSEVLDKCAIEAPKDGCIGIMKFHDKHDFLMFVPTDMNKTDVLNLSKDETEFMKTLPKGGRAGAAGGVVDIDTDSHSISTGVKTETMILIPRPRGVGVSLIYENKKGEVNSMQSIYNDIYMQSLNTAAKTNQIKLSLSYRHILICEMISRIKTYAIAFSLGIIDNTINPFTDFNDLFTSKKELIAYFNRGHSFFHAVLLSWASTTGEMRNHQAIAAHKDGNKSHPIETYSIFGRVHPSVDYHKTIEELIKPAYLATPIHGKVAKIVCGEHVVNCSLKETYHVPDYGRNIYNWSKVHGPK